MEIASQIALKVLQECQNLTVLILTKNFVGEEMPIDAIRGFRNIRALAIINSALTGSLPSRYEIAGSSDFSIYHGIV